jgi:hypothetical protein
MIVSFMKAAGTEASAAWMSQLDFYFTGPRWFGSGREGFLWAFPRRRIFYPYLLEKRLAKGGVEDWSKKFACGLRRACRIVTSVVELGVN